MSIGLRIQSRRKELNMSASELARRLGKDRSTVYRYESGEIENLPLDVLVPIADALDCTPAYLLGWEDNDSDPKTQKPTIRIVPRPDCKINFDKLQVAIDKCSTNKLNERGTDELLKFVIERVSEYSEMLSKIPEYQAVPLLNAAHADDYANAPEELKKQEEDIMDDENF
jgi:transcriptional regulator with XRE-family HTH domain